MTTNILHVISSIRGKESQSTRLGFEIIKKLKDKHPKCSIKTRDLSKKPFEHLTQKHFESSKKIDAIKELENADFIVISVPMWNFGIPSVLKAWIDHIVRANLTFHYSKDGPIGHLSGKKAYIAIASGGIYSTGHMKDYDFVEPYLKAVLGFIGITNILVFRVEGTAVSELKENALEIAIQKITL